MVIFIFIWWFGCHWFPPCGFIFKNISIILPLYINLYFSLCHIIFYEVWVLLSSSSSSSQLMDVSWCCAHSRSVLFQTLHRCQRDTRLCTYLINYAIFYPLTLPQLRESSVSTPSFTLPYHPFPPSPPSPPYPLPPSDQYPPVPTTTSPPATPNFSPPPCRGP